SARLSACAWARARSASASLAADEQDTQKGTPEKLRDAITRTKRTREEGDAPSPDSGGASRRRAHGTGAVASPTHAEFVRAASVPAPGSGGGADAGPSSFTAGPGSRTTAGPARGHPADGGWPPLPRSV